MSGTASTQLKRLLSLIPEVADGELHDIDEISARMSVPREVILADLKAMADRDDPGGFVEGVRIYIERDRVAVSSDQFLRPMGLTLDELCALELGLAMLRAECPPDETTAVERARERLRKIIHNLPVGYDAFEARYAELAPTDGLPHLGEVRKALRDHRKLRITYRSAAAVEATTRVVRPYSLVPASGMWYAIAYCENSEGLRVFRMDRVEEATLLPDRFEIPGTFSASGALREGRGLLADAPSGGLKVRYSRRVARWIAEREGREPASDGSLTIEHPLASEEWGVRHVLQYGPDAELLEPVELREEVKAKLEKMRGHQ